jgi:post-segregation antitoxin (ccd killing protein)
VKRTSATNISLPVELQERIGKLREAGLLNVSAVCRAALEAEVARLERQRRKR